MAEDSPQGRVLKKLDLSLAHVNDAPAPKKQPVAGDQFEEKTVVNPSDSPDATKSDLPEGIPEVIAGRYKVLRQIGKGGMGVVLLALDDRLGRHVAIKRLIFRSNNMKQVQRRFLREAQTIAGLGHVNIVNVFDIGQDGEVGYITMEYVPGPQLNPSVIPEIPPAPVTLDHYIKVKGPMNQDDAIAVMLKLCNAMGYAHKQGTIHRDIKPTNILLTDILEPKVVDFGLARPIDITKTEEITLEGTMLGTPEYSAPEQWGDLKEVGIPSDIYALGGVFWYILTGRIPRFFRESELSGELGNIISKALSQRPSDRFQYADDMAKALQALQYVEMETSREIPSPAVSDTQSMPAGGWPCQNCNTINPESAHFCIQCGASGMHTCVLCGADMRVGAQFCPSCGEDVQFAEEAVGILLTAKNHANFLEFETALQKVEPLIQKNIEARTLSKEWQAKVEERRGILARMEKAIQVYDLKEAIDNAAKIKGLVPMECLSESLDFGLVVKHSELQTDLRRMLIGAATKAHEEYDLEQFSTSIQALNRIFGENVCGAVNSQLSAILSDLDQAMTNAGLALGMNCISKALEAINEIPPWKNGELGDRRTRLNQSCAELKDERSQIIMDIEAAVFNERYSEALTLITKMARFRLPPDHSDVDPAQADLDANERIVKVDKVLTHTIDENISSWTKNNCWDNIRNALVALEQGDSRNWQELMQRLKYSVKSEIKQRYEKAIEYEKKGKYALAESAWKKFLLAPEELIPPAYLTESKEFHSRRTLEMVRKGRYRAINGAVLLWLLFIAFSSWMIWFPLYKGQAFWDYLGESVLGQIGLQGLPISPGQDLGFQNAMLPALIQLFLFTIAVIACKSKLLHRSPRSLTRYASLPRMLAFGAIAALSPLAMVVYESYYHWVYKPQSLIPLLHPYLLITLIWVGLDLFKGFKKDRIPANIALSISWFLASFLMLSKRHGADSVVRTIMYPEDAQLFELTVWPTMALLHMMIYMMIIVVEHQLYKRKHGSNIIDKLVDDDSSTTDCFHMKPTDQ